MLKHSFQAYLTEQQAAGMLKANKSYEVVQELAFALLTLSSDQLEQLFSDHPDKIEKVIDHLVELHSRLDNTKQVILEAIHHATLVLDNLEMDCSQVSRVLS